MICTKCQKDYDDSCFHSKGNGKKHKQCKYCKRIAIKNHYNNNKSDYIARAKKKNKEIKSKILDISNKLKSVPCTDCGKTFPPYAMDFDHLDKFEKVCNVSDIIKNTSLRKFLLEVQKCEVVCACCHRIRTHNRRINSKKSQVNKII